MKKIIAIVVVLLIIGGVVWRFNASSTPGNTDKPADEVKVPTSQTVQVSDKISEYKNDELGFSVKYPTVWERGEAVSGVVFTVPTSDLKEKNTVGKLEATIDVASGKCTFPPVTTVKERDAVKVGDLTFNMISIANTIQGRNYFNRMYSLQKDSICYYFTFASITLSPTSKGFVGADAQTVGATNKTLVDTADTQFKDMIKTFAFVVGPQGKDEAQVAPKK